MELVLKSQFEFGDPEKESLNNISGLKSIKVIIDIKGEKEKLDYYHLDLLPTCSWL